MAGGTIRLGVVGLGKIARDQHLPAIAASPRFELVATASPDGGIAGTPAFPDLAALLGTGPELDAVVLCTPPSVRAVLAMEALQAGLHVMLEKPPAACVSQAQSLADSAAAAGRSLFATWHSRETSCVDKAAAWLKGRQVERVEVTWREDVRVWHPGQDWLLAAGGFGVFDPAINAFSILTAILPAPLALKSARLGVPANRQAPMTADLVMRHGRIAPVLCALSILHSGQQEWNIVVTTDAGVLELSTGGHQLAIDEQEHPAGDDNEYARIYDRFAELIDRGASDVDIRPLVLVGDAMLLGETARLPDFDF